MRPTNIDIDCRSDLALRITTQMEHHNSSLLTGSKLRWEICRGQDACATAPALSALTRLLARSKSKGVERSQRLYIQLYIFRATRPAVAPRPVNNERICTTVLQLDPRLTPPNSKQSMVWTKQPSCYTSIVSNFRRRHASRKPNDHTLSHRLCARTVPSPDRRDGRGRRKPGRSPI